VARRTLSFDGGGIRIEPLARQALREQNGLLMIPTSGQSTNDALVRAQVHADRNRR